MPGNPFEQRVWQGASRLELRSAGPGRLPDVAELDDLVVIFDGVLHNAAAMAAMLDAPEGISPAGLVARAHVKWGDGAFRRIKASFACALWQASTNTLKLVRDAVGTYPMFFSEAGGRVAFGVDAEPLLSLPWVSRTLNRAMIADHLSHRWLSHHETHYQELSRVPAGFIVTWQGGVRRFERYWYPVDPSGRIEWVHDEALHEFQSVFEEAIARCLRQGPRGDLPQRRIRLGQHRRHRRELEPPPRDGSAHRRVALLPGSVLQRRARPALRRLTARPRSRRAQSRRRDGLCRD